MYKASSYDWVCLTISFKVNDNRIFKKYAKMWEIASILMNIEFDSEPVYGDNDKYIKAKTKSYEDKVNRNFQGKTIPKENESYKCFFIDNARFCS